MNEKQFIENLSAVCLFLEELREHKYQDSGKGLDKIIYIINSCDYDVRGLEDLYQLLNELFKTLDILKD